MLWRVHLRNSTKANVWAVRLLCSIEHSVSEDGAFLNCVFLSYNIPSAPHKDSNNHRDVCNMLIPLSVWRGGELWVARFRGSVQAGHVRSILPPCLKFDARKLHDVMPWSGDRFLLGTFHTRDDCRG